METYLSGNAEPTSLNNDFSSFGEDTLYQKVALKNNDEDNDLYSVRVYKFNENCGLYVVFATETEDAEDLIFDIMLSLIHISFVLSVDWCFSVNWLLFFR